MQDQRNYYEILGVARNATTDEIKVAYKEIARAYHPDSNYYREIVTDAAQNAQSVELFKFYTAAYNTLSSPHKRAQYDLSLPPDIQPWDDDAEDFHRQNLVSKVHTRRQSGGPVSGAFGVFGAVESPQVDDELQQKIEEQLRKQRRKTKTFGIIRRILWAIGL